MSRFVVVKLGGNVLGDEGLAEDVIDSLAEDLRSLCQEGVSPVIVHGAGPQISALMDELGIAPTFIDGRRVTDDRTLSVAAMALSHVNLLLVAALNRRGVGAMGVAGPDRGLLLGSTGASTWGRVADSVTVRDAVLREMAARGAIPVVNPISVDAHGHLLNCNADTVAGAISAALSAEALVLLSDVDQLRLDPDDPATAISTVSLDHVRELMLSGAIRDGMKPKMEAAISAVDAGARRVVLASGERRRAITDSLNALGPHTEVVR
jgi:acetylglutamate kinase